MILALQIWSTTDAKTKNVNPCASCGSVELMKIREEDSASPSPPQWIFCPFLLRALHDGFAKETQSNYLPKPAPSSLKVT